MQVSIVQRYEHQSGLAEYDLDELWTHAMFTAQHSQALAEASARPAGLSPDDYYTCGLLHCRTTRSRRPETGSVGLEEELPADPEDGLAPPAHRSEPMRQVLDGPIRVHATGDHL
jgi:hypothetical protein